MSAEEVIMDTFTLRKLLCNSCVSFPLLYKYL